MTERPNTTFKAGSRYYEFPDGVQHPGVTSILGMLPKPWLGAWNGKMAAEWAVAHMSVLNDLVGRDDKAAVELIKGAARRSTAGSADLGTAIHEYAEATMLGAPVVDPISDDEAGMRRAFDAFVTDWKPELVVSEFTIRNDSVGYAGSGDSVLSIGGVNVIVDYKSGKGIHEEVALQLVAYARAESFADGSPLPLIEAGAVLHIRPDIYKFHPVKLTDEGFEYFKALRKVFDWESSKRSFLGKPITPNN
jgi:hypothetical protein